MRKRRPNFLASPSAKNVIRTPARPAGIIHKLVCALLSRGNSTESTRKSLQPQTPTSQNFPTPAIIVAVVCCACCAVLCRTIAIVQCLRSSGAHVSAQVFCGAHKYVNRWPPRYRNGNFWPLLFLRPNMHNMLRAALLRLNVRSQSVRKRPRRRGRRTRKFRKRTRKTSHIVYDSRWLSHIRPRLSLSLTSNGRPKQFGLMLQTRCRKI